MLPSERFHRRGSPCERAAHRARSSVHMPGVVSCPAPDAGWFHTLHQPIVALVQRGVGASTRQGDGDQSFWSSVAARVLPAYCQANDRGRWCPGSRRVFLVANRTLVPKPGVAVSALDRAPAIAPSRRSEIRDRHRRPERWASAHIVSRTDAMSSYTSGKKEDQRSSRTPQSCEERRE